MDPSQPEKPDTSPLDDVRPMTPAEAAEWLRLADLGIADPERCVLYLRETGQITKRKIAGKPAFILRDLRAYVMRSTETQSGSAGPRAFKLQK